MSDYEIYACHNTKIAMDKLTRRNYSPTLPKALSSQPLADSVRHRRYFDSFSYVYDVD